MLAVAVANTHPTALVTACSPLLRFGCRFFCDYCDAYLTHDSPAGRKQHTRGERPLPPLHECAARCVDVAMTALLLSFSVVAAGWKHRQNFQQHYQQFYPAFVAKRQAMEYAMGMAYPPPMPPPGMMAPPPPMPFMPPPQPPMAGTPGHYGPAPTSAASIVPPPPRAPPTTTATAPPSS